MILAGGTGGHVFPGLAVAQELRSRDVPVVWLGGSEGIETRVVPAAGFPLEQVRVSALRGKGTLSWMTAPFRVARATREAAAILRRCNPRCVLAFGGFAAGPGGLAARLQRRALVVHEQNRIPGLTNRVLARIATVVLCGFPDAFANGTFSGNPVRAEIVQLNAEARPAPQASRPARLLVLGGSQGARAINDALPGCIAATALGNDLTVRHQSGVADSQRVAELYRDFGVSAEVEPFIDDMVDAYRWADLVVCRAGALTLAELALAGLAAVVVPLPTAADDHQTANARYHADAGAAVLQPQETINPEAFAPVLASLLTQRERLQAMGQAHRKLATPDAARRVAEACLAVAA